MSDTAIQRLNMVESQVRPSDLTDRRITRAMLALPRELFVPAGVRSVCYMDRDLPLTLGGRDGRMLLAPRVQAKLMQALDIPETGTVLDIGCGYGYSTALLAELAERVVGIEPDAAMIEAGQAVFKELEISRATLMVGDLTTGNADAGPYDAILINGAVNAVPDNLLDQLKDGGRLVAIDVSQGVGRATQWQRIGAQFAKRAVFDAEASVLPGYEVEPGFVF